MIVVNILMCILVAIISWVIHVVRGDMIQIFVMIRGTAMATGVTTVPVGLLHVVRIANYMVIIMIRVAMVRLKSPGHVLGLIRDAQVLFVMAVIRLIFVICLEIIAIGKMMLA